jgi:spermidine/putrescine transport system ATP-binding protein
VAGFEEPTAGRIMLDGVDVARLAPNKRNVNTVFQSYALFPFLDVAGNVAFGLRYKSLDKSETKRRVGEMLDLVQLPGYEKRRVNQLSGGQQQRVALARALVLNPAVLLLDEPLGALDAKLRRTLQVELKAIQERVGITFLYVTHDQEEALTMSDRLAVMTGGRFAQIGTPRVLYEEPADAYVADFLGVSNLMDADVVRAGVDSAVSPGTGRPCRLRIGDFEIEAGCGSVNSVGAVRLAIRPERVQLDEFGTTGQNRLPAMVERLVFLGDPGVRPARARRPAPSPRSERRPQTALFPGNTGKCPVTFGRAARSRGRRFESQPGNGRAARKRRSRRSSNLTRRSGARTCDLRSGL